MKSTNMKLTITEKNENITLEWDDVSLELSYSGDINFTEFVVKLVAYYDQDTEIKFDLKEDDYDPKLSLVLSSIDGIINEFNKQFEAVSDKAQ